MRKRGTGRRERCDVNWMIDCVKRKGRRAKSGRINPRDNANKANNPHTLVGKLRFAARRIPARKARESQKRGIGDVQALAAGFYG
jgi:hypothetical protein